MTISGDSPPTRSKIVMRAWAIKRRRDVGVPSQVLAELVLIGCRDHVGLVVVGSETSGIYGLGTIVVLPRITGRAEGVRPAEMDAVHRGELLA